MFTPGVTTGGQFVPNLFLWTDGRTDGQCSNCVIWDTAAAESRDSDTQRAVRKDAAAAREAKQHCKAHSPPPSLITHLSDSF